MNHGDHNLQGPTAQVPQGASVSTGAISPGTDRIGSRRRRGPERGCSPIVAGLFASRTAPRKANDTPPDDLSLC